MEFDKDGRIILPASVRQEQESENNAIILTKVQINLASPAIAHLKVELGSGVPGNHSSLLGEIAGFCEYYAKANYRTVDSEVILSSNNVTIIARSSMLMYEFLHQLAADLRTRYEGQRFKVVMRGGFDR